MFAPLRLAASMRRRRSAGPGMRSAARASALVRPSRVAVVAACAALTWASALSCSPDAPSDACVEVSAECNPIVSPPTFDAIYSNILQGSCASGAGACHGRGAGGLSMDTADAAFEGLSARLTPGDISCSPLVQRIESTDPARRMPPGPTPLTEPQRCAIRQWIANGAER